MKTRIVGCAVALMLVACAHRAPFAAVPSADRLDAEDWGPHHVPMEWWYVSAVAHELDLAFHVSFFKAYAPEGRRVLGIPARRLMTRPAHIAHVAVTDLKAGRHTFDERRSLRGAGSHTSDRPLHVGLRGWTLRENPSDGSFRLRAGDVDVRLEPRKPRVVHPPGHSGTNATGLLAYQSVTRLAARGCVDGRRFEGTAWMDHQWGDQIPASTAVWDWCGLHDENQGVDIMLYRVSDRTGRVVQHFGTVTDACGVVHGLKDLQIEIEQRWLSATGRRHNVALSGTADGFTVRTRPLRLQQEIRSKTTELVYWEGPARFQGHWRGQRIAGHGTVETVCDH